jgi:hypothetical protein
MASPRRKQHTAATDPMSAPPPHLPMAQATPGSGGGRGGAKWAPSRQIEYGVYFLIIAVWWMHTFSGAIDLSDQFVTKIAGVGWGRSRKLENAGLVAGWLPWTSRRMDMVSDRLLLASTTAQYALSRGMLGGVTGAGIAATECTRANTPSLVVTGGSRLLTFTFQHTMTSLLQHTMPSLTITLCRHSPTHRPTANTPASATNSCC